MRGLVVPAENEDFAADPVELFFDLSYVFAFSQLVGVLVRRPDWPTVGEVTVVFSLLWLTWSQLTWAANAVPGKARTTRLIFLVATATSVPMAASVSTAFDNSGLLFAVPVTVLAMLGLGLALEGARDASGTNQGRGFGAAVIASCTLLLGGAFFDDGIRIGLWVAAVTAYVLGTFQTTGTDWMLRAGHFAERHGLILIVALGEIIVAVGKPLVDSLEETEGLSCDSVVALVATGVLGCVLWWAYFDRVQRALEHRLADTDGSARSTLARDDYTFFHFPIVAGIVALAAGLEEATLHPDKPIPLAFRIMLVSGLALFLGGISATVYRTFAVPATERLVAIAMIAMLLFLGSSLTGVWVIVIVDVILIAALAVEQRRIETPRSTHIDAASS